jgi:phosphonoacetaldehyde hydrolase
LIYTHVYIGIQEDINKEEEKMTFARRGLQGLQQRLPRLDHKKMGTSFNNSFNNSFNTKPSFNTRGGSKRLKLAVLDWSGTVSDIFSNAPNYGFVKLFANHGLPISMNEARGPMGKSKLPHVKDICSIPRVANLIFEKNKKLLLEKRNGIKISTSKMATIITPESIYNDYVETQIQVLEKHPEFLNIIPGALKTFDTLRNQLGMKIGLTTGFPKSISDKFEQAAKKQGLLVDKCLASDQVIEGRPSAEGMWKLMDDIPETRFEISAKNNVPEKNIFTVKVDDTKNGIGEGINSGSWTVGVYATSSYMGIDSVKDYRNLKPKELEERLNYSKNELQSYSSSSSSPLGGCVDFLIPYIGDLPAICNMINYRLSRGLIPGQLPTETSF